MNCLVTSSWAMRYLEDVDKAFPQVDFVTAESDEELVKLAADAEIVFGAVSREVFQAAKKLRWIQSPSAGVEWMRRVPELADSDVIVTNMRGAHASTIAEHAFGMLIILARNFFSLYESQKRKEWQRPLEKPGVGLMGMTMGVIGLGNIGRAIARRGHAFGMDVIAVDAHKVPQPEYVSELGLLDAMPDLLQRSDVVVVATPITDETRGMMGPDQLKLMKPSAYLLVMSRGGIIHEPTLVQMLHAGQLAGAGLDVTETEPLPADNPLWDAPNIFITPHSSPSSQQTVENVAAILSENLKKYLAGEPLTNVVDKKLGY